MPPKTALGRWLLKKQIKKETKKEAGKAATNFAGPIQTRLQDIAQQFAAIPAGTLKDTITRQHTEFSQRLLAPPTEPQQALSFWTLLDEKSRELETLAADAAVAGDKLTRWSDDMLTALRQTLQGEHASVRALFAAELKRIEDIGVVAHQKFNQRDFGGSETSAGQVYFACQAATAKVPAAAQYVAVRDPALIRVTALQNDPQKARDAAPQLLRLGKLIKEMRDKEAAMDYAGALVECQAVVGVRKIASKSAKAKGDYDAKKLSVEGEILKLRGHLMAVYARNELDALDRRVAASATLSTKEGGGYQKGLGELLMVEKSLADVKALLAEAWNVSKRTPQLSKKLEDEGLDPARAALIAGNAVKLLCLEKDLSTDDAIKMAKDAQGFIDDDGISEPDALMCARVQFTLEDEGVPPDRAKSIGRHMRGGGTSTGDDVKAVARKMMNMSKGVMDALTNAGITTVACRGPITEVLPELMGELPRGWPVGMSWDSVPGVCSGSSNQVVIGTMDDGAGQRKVPGQNEGPLPHGTPDLVGHEAGHAFDTCDGTYKSQDPGFLAARTLCISDPDATPPIVGSMVPGTDDYFLTRAEGGTNDPGATSETFAESFAMHFAGNSRWPKLEEFWATQPFGI